jgi:hypothetical protein
MIPNQQNGDNAAVMQALMTTMASMQAELARMNSANRQPASLANANQHTQMGFPSVPTAAPQPAAQMVPPSSSSGSHFGSRVDTPASDRSSIFGSSLMSAVVSLPVHPVQHQFTAQGSPTPSLLAFKLAEARAAEAVKGSARAKPKS